MVFTWKSPPHGAPVLSYRCPRMLVWLVSDPLLPKLPLERVMAGGSKIRFHRAIRPGDVLVGKRELEDLYQKQGASGPLLFIIYKMTVTTESGELVMEETQTRIAR